MTIIAFALLCLGSDRVSGSTAKHGRPMHALKVGELSQWFKVLVSKPSEFPFRIRGPKSFVLRQIIENTARNSSD